MKFVFHVVNQGLRSLVLGGRRLAALTIALSVSSAPAIVADTIVFNDGRRSDDCKIESAQWDQVRYTVGNGGAQTAPSERIESIFRTPRGAGLASGRRALDRGRYNAAIKALAQSGSVDWEVAETAYLLAKAHEAKGDRKTAEANYKKYVSKHQAEKDWWIPHALYNLGLLQLSGKKAKSADQTFAKLDEFGGNWSARAKLGRARGVVLAKNQGQYLEQAQSLGTLTRNTRAPAALRAEAYVIRARIFVLGRQYDRAIDELRRTFFNPPNSRNNIYSHARADATLAIGLAYLASGGKKNLEQAEIWLLRVPALYRNEGRVYREACDGLSRVYEGLGNNARSQEWEKRAGDEGNSP